MFLKVDACGVSSWFSLQWLNTRNLYKNGVEVPITTSKASRQSS